MQAHKTFFSGKVLKATLLKMFMSEKKKKGMESCLGFVFFPGGVPSLFSPILSKDLSGPKYSSSKKFFRIASKNFCLRNVKIV